MHKDAEQALTYWTKGAGAVLPLSVRTKELICSSSSGALDPHIRMTRVTGWMKLKSG